MGIPPCKEVFSAGVVPAAYGVEAPIRDFFPSILQVRIESSCVHRVARLANSETTRGLRIMCSFAPAPAHPP
jgi:hypothetical protein